VLAEDMSLGAERATAVFRIFQEILTNVARHSHATRVEISMQEQNGNIILEVRDNGVGINESAVEDRRSLGLLVMRERVLVFGGKISIEGAPGKGTMVTVCIPIE
jgi:signal transduction histidine kinase